MVDVEAGEGVDEAARSAWMFFQISADFTYDPSLVLEPHPWGALVAEEPGLDRCTTWISRSR